MILTLPFACDILLACHTSTMLISESFLISTIAILAVDNYFLLAVGLLLIRHYLPKGSENLGIFSTLSSCRYVSGRPPLLLIRHDGSLIPIAILLINALPADHLYCSCDTSKNEVTIQCLDLHIIALSHLLMRKRINKAAKKYKKPCIL